MAKYLITAGGNSNASGSWSNVSSASAGGDGVPTASDDVVLDVLSGQLTINAAFVNRSFECNNASTYGSTITWNVSTTMTIGDATAGANNVAFRFAGTVNLGGPATSQIALISTSATQQNMYCGGKTLGTVSINSASNGNYILNGTFRNDGAGASFTVTKGTFDSGNQTMTLTNIQSNNSNVRSISLGSSTITVSSTLTFTTTTNLTWNAGTSSITLGTSGSSFSGGGLAFYDVTLNRSGAFSLDGANSFHNLTRTGAANKISTMVLSADQTVSNIFTVNSNSNINRQSLSSDVKGTARQITAATFTFTNTVDMQDITGAGAATWTVAGGGGTALGDCGGNSGITFTTPATQTATGTASFTWSTHGWTSRVPLPQDDVVIPNGFVAGRTITQDMPRMGKSITFSCSGSPTLSMSVATSVFGSWDSTGLGSISGSSTLTFEGRGSFTITSAGISFASVPVTIDCVSGTVSLSDAFTTAASVTLLSGTLTGGTANFTSSSSFLSNVASTQARVLNMGSGTWTFSGTGTVWNIVTGGGGITLDGQTSTIVVSNTSATSKNFTGAGLVYNNFTASGDNIQITGANTFNVLAISNAGLSNGLLLNAGVTTTISSLTCNGFASNLAKLVSTSAGSAATLACTNPVTCDFLSVKDNTFSGGSGNPTAYAGPNGTLVSGTTNWSATTRPQPIRKPFIINGAVTRAACF